MRVPGEVVAESVCQFEDPKAIEKAFYGGLTEDDFYKTRLLDAYCPGQGREFSGFWVKEGGVLILATLSIRNFKSDVGGGLYNEGTLLVCRF